MEKFFDKRNKKITNLTLLADKLGHSIRENVSLFSVDDSNNLATFITESGTVIEGNYYFTDKIVFDNIVVESGDVFVDEEKFDSASRNQISLLVDSIYSDNLSQTGEIFESIVDSWSQKIRFNDTVGRLREKTESFNKTFNILETSEFERFIELSENISKFLSENSDKIMSVPEIRNAVRLSETVSKSFDCERMSLEDLSESKSVEYSLNETLDFYEMVCKQELLKKEILESKRSFDNVWVTEECISNLTSKMFSDENEIKQALVEAFVEIPYIALISKKQLSSTIQKNLTTLHEDIEFSKTDIKEFTKVLFEMKKPLRDLVSNLLQEKYGINLNNVKEVPTFKTLLNTQSIIFESLSKMAPRGSVVKECLHNMSEMLKGKNGVEAVDINAGMKYLFEHSLLSELYDNSPVASTFDLNESVGDSDMVTFIMNELMLEESPESKRKREVADKRKEKESEGPESDKSTKKKERKDEEEEASSLSTKELIDSLKEIEELIGEPEELSEE